MCGIVGLFSKSPEIEQALGSHLAAMLEQMSDRGPDSAGVAVYRDPAPSGASKLTLFSADPLQDWEALAAELGNAFGGSPAPEVRASHAVLVVNAEAPEAEAWIRSVHPELRVMSAGRTIEIYKEVGRPEAFVRAFQVEDFQGTHALGHTRMATESRVTTRARTRSPRVTTSASSTTARCRTTIASGRTCAARASSSRRRTTPKWRPAISPGWLRDGASLEQALEGCLEDLDGFYTFLVGTEDGFAVLRDPIACKPAVLAETDDWVAMASSGARSPSFPVRPRRAPGSRFRASSTPGSGRRSDGGGRSDGNAFGRGRRSRRDAPPRAQPTPPRSVCCARTESLARAQPERSARGRLRPRRGRRGRKSTATSATTAPG